MWKDYNEVEVFETISRLYPNLLYVEWEDDKVGDIYFNDLNIYKYQLFVSDYGNQGGIIQIALEPFDECSLHLRLYLSLQQGYVYMIDDLEIPDESCVRLYNKNINIKYGDPVHYTEYDRESIMRRHTIKSIINDGE